MTKRKSRMSKSQKPAADISKIIREEIEKHPDVQVILEIVARSRELSATQPPVDFELVPTTTTATASISQYPFVAA